MNVRPLIWAALVCTIGAPVIATANTGSNPEPESAKEWRFRVLLDDTEIGYHTFRLTEQAGELVVDSEARFRVRILFFDAYRYEHVNRERWNERCLMGIDSKTDVNGKTTRVSGSDDGREFVVQAGDGTVAIGDCVMSFAYWNPAFLEQKRLLNSQTGDYVDVDIRRVGKEEVAVRGQSVSATGFELAADKLNMELWYSPDREWLGLQSTTKGGRMLRYVLL
jgi:hypothetical protein